MSAHVNDDIKKDDKEEGGGHEGDDFAYYDLENDNIRIVECETTAGPFAIEFRKDWSPLGFERAVELFERGFYDQSHFFRVVPNFLVQFGISYSEDEELQKFAAQTIKDDPQLDPRIEFDEGIVSFAGNGENSRTSHLFVSYGKNANLGTQLWETPVGIVVRGMETLLDLNHEYGDMPPWGKGPEQPKIHSGGLAYMEKEFPHLDRFLACHVVHPQKHEEREELEESEEMEEVYENDGGKDDMVQVDTVVVKPKTATKSLRAADVTESATNGFERPLLGAIAVVLLILIAISKRKMGSHSKSL